MHSMQASKWETNLEREAVILWQKGLIDDHILVFEKKIQHINISCSDAVKKQAVMHYLNLKEKVIQAPFEELHLLYIFYMEVR